MDLKYRSLAVVKLSLLPAMEPVLKELPAVFSFRVQLCIAGYELIAAEEPEYF